MDILALVPGAVGIASSPLTVAAIVFLLGQRRGHGSAVACAVGWITTIVVALVVSVLLGERLPAPSDDGVPVQAIVALCASVLLLALAVWQWVRRTLPDGSPASTRWADAMEAVGPARAFGLGGLLFLSPKLFVLVFAAGLAFGDADPSAPETVVAGALFVLVSGSTALLPILLAATLGSHARRALDGMRRWIARWGSLSLVAVLVVLAVVQLAIGLAGLHAAA
ncbi:GAP family protein [Curtobacterium sp. 22159]|uniref:GAP family protein n=1 Tax=Curtobacterium sp. 22159 TaxID=3453882 RepID=UPI003F82FF63